MGRRSLITSRELDSLISAFNSARKRARQDELINSQQGMEKETLPQYEIIGFDFNEETRISHILFLETKMYRKIERYVTQNYVRYPIYSGWITKTKEIKKTIKLTNEMLECLNNHSDWLIREFATEIIEKTNNQDLVPSWFYNQLISKKKTLESTNNNAAFENYRAKMNEEIKKENSMISTISSEIENVEQENQKLNIKINKKISKLKKLKTKKCSFVKSVLTLGILSKQARSKRTLKLNNKISIIQKCIDDKNKKLNKLNSTKKEHENDIKKFNKSINDKLKEKNARQKEIDDKYDEEFSGVKKLMTEVKETSDFIPLKQFAGIKYEKIIGCYIIHNKEFDKYYVGQSKDVVKRINRDHFNGTKVKNIIFAEDYFKSKLEDKSKIFEVKVIRLNTKDELDRTEKALIEQYDSFNNGYNGTNGNI